MIPLSVQKTQAGSASEKLSSLPDPGLTEDSVLTYLRDNPDLLQQLGRLQLPSEEAEVRSEKQTLPPVIPPGPGTPGMVIMMTVRIRMMMTCQAPAPWSRLMASPVTPAWPTAR